MSDSFASLLGVPDPSNPNAPVAPAPKLTAKQLCRALLATPQYRESLLRRMLMDDLPPAVECKLWEYAYGKPVEKIEHTGKDGNPIETITEVRRVIVRMPEAEASVEQDRTIH